MNYSIKTFGCKVNTYDTSLIQKQLNQISLKENSSSPIHIVNTCAVTETAIADSLRWIRTFKKKNPQTQIVVTGCGTQTEIQRYSESSDVDLIISNSHKHQFAEILDNFKNKKNLTRVFHSNIFKLNHKGEGGQVENHHTRLFLKIQDGCSQFCTFCIIPFARGKSRSLSCRNLIDQINKHHSQGIQEVVLTGVHIADYFDLETQTNLEGLVQKVLKETSIPRIRLSSLEPVELTDKLLSFYQNKRMCPHFHLSIQSGSTKVLKEMKRKYTKKEVLNGFEKIKKSFPSAFVGMDIIAGFPGETQKEFEETYELLSLSSWTQMHVFPYSPRPQTYALRSSEHLPRSMIVRRAGLLRNLSEQRYEQKARLQINTIKTFLPLKKGALSRDYWSAEWESSIKKEQKARLLSWNKKNKTFIVKILSGKTP